MTSDTQLHELLRGAAWLPDDVRRADRYAPIDEAPLGSGTTLFVVSVVGGPAHGRLLFAPAHRDGTGRLADAQGSEGFDLACVRLMTAGGRIRTARGGHVDFRGGGPAARAVSPLPFAQGWSSNSLSLLDIDGRPHLHKTYRSLGAEVREPELLRLLDGCAHTPRWFGDYGYVPPGGAERLALGVVYAYAPGSGIDTPLRANLRALWPGLTGSQASAPHRAGGGAGDLEGLVRDHLAPLAAPLRTARSFLGGFHEELRTRLGRGTPPPDYPVERALRAAEERCGALAERAGREALLPAAALDSAFGSLAREIALLRTAFDDAGPHPAGPCHGDLHLSHLLWDPPRLIDISTPSTGPDDPGWAEQSPLQDLVALERALEYFGADEAAYESARLLGVDPTQTMLASLDGGAGLPPRERSVLLLVFEAADTWRRHVAGLLLAPAGSDGAPAGPGLPDEPLRRLLYLRRLLHELDYNFAHARPYHAAIDLRHAMALGLPSPLSRTLTTRT
ncbi:phosphotransferase [Streptomyces sp. NK15101]|uniref:phosphotransferase n=1 Tax=Streptomyces sp. NK15101 TaxID=2873261 RepID=UPI0027DF5D74|nr:phosphotransferase [Streptomyces sp. NK15101]